VSNYNLARKKLARALREAYPLLLEEQEEDDPEFQIDTSEALVGRWVVYFETTAPATLEDEQGTHHSYAKGLFCISDDGSGESPMQDWEIIGITRYCCENEIFG